MEISDAVILQYLQLSEVLAVLSTNQQIRSHFFKTHVVGAIPCLDKVVVPPKAVINGQQLSLLWLFICQHLRIAIYNASPQSAGQSFALKQLVLWSPHLRKLIVARPIPCSLKRIASLPPDTCSSLCELTLGRPGLNNVVVTDCAMEHIVKAFGQQLIRLKVIKFNQLTSDTVNHIANHCQLTHLSIVSCEGISDTLLRSPQGMKHLLASQGPSLVELDIRFSVEMSDDLLQCIMSCCPSLRTFVASRTTSITILPSLSSCVWSTFCSHFQSSYLLYIDCVGQEGCNDQPVVFLHEGDLISLSSTLRSRVVVRQLDQRSLFGRPSRAPAIGLGHDSPTATCLSFLPSMMNSPLYQGMFGSSRPMGEVSESTTDTTREWKGKGNDWIMCQSMDMQLEVDDDDDDDEAEEMKKNEENGFEDGGNGRERGDRLHEFCSVGFPGLCMSREQAP